MSWYIYFSLFGEAPQSTAWGKMDWKENTLAVKLCWFCIIEWWHMTKCTHMLENSLYSLVISVDLPRLMGAIHGGAVGEGGLPHGRFYIENDLKTYSTPRTAGTCCPHGWSPHSCQIGLKYTVLLLFSVCDFDCCLNKYAINMKFNSRW